MSRRVKIAGAPGEPMSATSSIVQGDPFAMGLLNGHMTVLYAAMSAETDAEAYGYADDDNGDATAKEDVDNTEIFNRTTNEWPRASRNSRHTKMRSGTTSSSFRIMVASVAWPRT